MRHSHPVGAVREVRHDVVVGLFGGERALQERIRNSRSDGVLATLETGALLIRYKVGKAVKLAIRSGRADNSDIGTTMETLDAIIRGERRTDGFVLR